MNQPLTINFYCFLSVLFFAICYAQDSNICSAQSDSCGECVSASSNCRWCADTDYAGSRCAYLGQHHDQSCSTIIKAGNNAQEITKKVPLTAGVVADDDENVVQVYPQEIKLTLVPHVPQTIQLKFKQAVDSPVDLYYLMDLSYTMADDKDTLVAVGQNLAKQMQNITKNFRLGFGSFVDKVMLPFTNTLPEKLERPCTLKDGSPCSPPYGFRHHLSLTKDATSFVNAVERQRISGNLDGPEGGLDAMMQVMVCQQLIGWREKARKLILYVTDESFHMAGDGKLAGIVRPNDESCHMAKERSGDYFYQASNYLDFPSVNQISVQAHRNQMIPIFAITADRLELYKTLKKHVANAHAAELASDSGNIIDIITKVYNDIQDTVTMDVLSGPTRLFDINYQVNCRNESKNSSTCENIKVNEVVDFNVTITAKECSKYDDGRPKPVEIHIGPKGFSERLKLLINIDCQCDCEKDAKPKRDKCNGHGIEQCGICKCDQGYSGRMCQCIGSDETVDIERCRANGTEPICSGRGKCNCGVCECEPANIYSGQYCQCNSQTCESFLDSDGKKRVCGAPNGNCYCGKCVCNPGWIYDGSAPCKCPTSEETCRDPASGLICNGNGVCSCGECKCKSTNDETWNGKYCTECPTCKQARCAKLIQLLTNEAIEDRISKFNSDPIFNVSYVEEFSLEFSDKSKEKKWAQCDIIRDNCQRVVRYLEHPIQVNVEVSLKQTCSEPIKQSTIIMSTVFGILLIGLLTLILWKLFTYFIDKHEYEKFERERKQARWQGGQNPIYKPSTSTFQNPAYATGKT